MNFRSRIFIMCISVIIVLMCNVFFLIQTSQDKSICVWEIKSQKIVTRLAGHTGIVVS